jgi:hypothetical protein
MHATHPWHFPWHWLWILLAVLALMLLLPAHARDAPPEPADAQMLVPRLILEDHVMSREQPEPCRRPRPEAIFFTADVYGYLWIRVDGAAKGDQPSVSWIRPGGLFHRQDLWDPLPEGGERCLTARLSIAGDVPADEPGQWLARVEWNGLLLVEHEFAVLDPSRPMITE